MAKKKKTKSTEQFSFEESFEQLQQIVTKLEDGKMSLNDSLASYEVGIQRLKQCYDALNQAELKIRQLVELDEDGNLVTSQFEIGHDEGPGRKQRSQGVKESENPDELF